MKLFSLILSIVVFFVSLYFFFDKIPFVESFNDGIYISLLVLLMAICVTGVIINWEVFRKNKKGKVILFVTNNFSKRERKYSK
ncbi:hypothetical protein [Flavobacterium suaedae]|uniref:hypothetical protein n=1 Tax=Flavobacterium suaedae TaxID=1767027 RepID=UPI001665DE24|nr:hypothetical protein [Flavobacterium suaedae]